MNSSQKLPPHKLVFVSLLLTASTGAFQLALHRWLTVESAPLLIRLQYAAVDSALFFPVFLVASTVAWRIVGVVRAERGGSTHPLERASVVASGSWVLLGGALFFRDQLIAHGILGGLFVTPLPGFLCGAELGIQPLAERTREAMLGLLRLAPVVFGTTALIAHMLDRIGAEKLSYARSTER